MQICTSPQTDNHAGTSPLWFLQAGCPSCRPTNNIKALKVLLNKKAVLSQDEPHNALTKVNIQTVNIN